MSTNVLLLTPDWPPKPCGVADFSKKLATNLKKYIYCEPLVFRHKNNLEILENKLGSKRFNIAHVILHSEHGNLNVDIFIKITEIIKTKYPNIKIIVSAIEIQNYAEEIIKNCDKVIVYDKDTYKKLKDKNLNRVPIIEMPCGATIEPSSRNGIRKVIMKKSSRDDLKFKVLYFGFIKKNKGINLLVSAVKCIPKNIPLKLKIKTAFHKSDSSNTNSNLFRNIAENTNDRIELLHGFMGIEKISRLYKNSDCCVLPFLDGLSNKRSSFFNALAFGLPVISTKTSKTFDEAKNKNFIRLIKKPTPKKLAKEIINVYNLKQKNILNRNNIINFFENNYSWDKIVTSVIKFYGSPY